MENTILKELLQVTSSNIFLYFRPSDPHPKKKSPLICYPCQEDKSYALLYIDLVEYEYIASRLNFYN